MNIKLILKNKDVRPDQFEKQYGKYVSSLFRLKYNQDKVEAVVNNYIEDPDNEEYSVEMRAMQDYRRECKLKAKTLFKII